LVVVGSPANADMERKKQKREGKKKKEEATLKIGAVVRGKCQRSLRRNTKQKKKKKEKWNTKGQKGGADQTKGFITSRTRSHEKKFRIGRSTARLKNVRFLPLD